MKKFLFAVITALATTGAQAVLNFGFESGDLTGWTTSLSGGSARVVASNSTGYISPATYLPVEGKYFLAIGSGDTDIWQTVSQTFSLSAGQTLTGGYAAFDWGDYTPFDDGARVRVLNAAGAEVATVFYQDGSGEPTGFNGPWSAWSWTAELTGSYTLEYGARNTLDGSGPETTFGYFDAASVVPEPTSIALLGVALAGLGLIRRKHV